MPYNSPYALPIPSTLQPSSVGWAPNVSFAEGMNGALFALAGGQTLNFALRFTGAVALAVRVPRSRPGYEKCWSVALHAGQDLSGVVQPIEPRVTYSRAPSAISAHLVETWIADAQAIILQPP